MRAFRFGSRVPHCGNASNLEAPRFKPNFLIEPTSASVFVFGICPTNIQYFDGLACRRKFHFRPESIYCVLVRMFRACGHLCLETFCWRPKASPRCDLRFPCATHHSSQRAAAFTRRKQSLIQRPRETRESNIRDDFGPGPAQLVPTGGFSGDVGPLARTAELPSTTGEQSYGFPSREVAMAWNDSKPKTSSTWFLPWCT